MLIVDWIAFGILAAAAALGASVGFGRGLKMFTSGIFGIIISFLVCYFTLGLVLSIPFVQELMSKFALYLVEHTSLGEDMAEIVCRVAVTITLFLIIQVIRIVIVRVIHCVLTANNLVLKLINKTLGAVLFLGLAVMLALFAFQIITWIGGSTYDTFCSYLAGSYFKLDVLMENNPLIYIYTKIM